MILDPTDQRIRDQGFNFVPFDRYLASPFQIPQSQTEEGPASAGLPLIYQNQGNQNQGGGFSKTMGGVTDLIQNFTLDTRNKYFDRQKTPLVDDLYQSKLNRTFMGFPSFREQELTGADLGQYIGSDTDVPLELTRAGNIQQGIGNVKEGIGNILSSIGGLGPISFALNKMDRFSSLPTADQKFIQMNMGYLGPTVFGDNQAELGKDPYGVNTRSLFGNYAEFVDEAARSDLTDEEYEALSPYQKTKVDFYRKQKKERERIEKETLEQQMADDKFYGSQGKSDPGDRSRKGATGRRPGSGGTVDRVESGPGRNVDDTGQAYDSGGREGFGYGLADGGIVDLVDIYD